MKHVISLVGISPHTALPHGPSKVFVDAFLWHKPDLGIVASYTPREKDTHDHFGIYRGADQIETFGQATVVAANAFLSCAKKEISFDSLYESYNFVFMRAGDVICKSFIKLGETAVIHGHFKNCQFKQMTAGGTMYKVPPRFDLKKCYKSYTESQFKEDEVDKSFVEVTEFGNLTGRGIKKGKI